MGIQFEDKASFVIYRDTGHLFSHQIAETILESAIENGYHERPASYLSDMKRYRITVTVEKLYG